MNYALFLLTQIDASGGTGGYTKHILHTWVVKNVMKVKGKRDIDYNLLAQLIKG